MASDYKLYITTLNLTLVNISLTETCYLVTLFRFQVTHRFTDNNIIVSCT